MGRFSRGVAVLCVTALVIVGGGAYAFASSSSGGTITVCVNHKTGALYQAKKCAKHDKKLTWNKQGPQGLMGAQGAQGTQGVQGGQGVQGEQGVAGPFPTTLPTGKTVVGTWDVEGESSGAGSSGATGSLATGAFSYVYSAPSQSVVFVAHGTTSTTCTGTYANPTAPNGDTCIYETSASNVYAGGVNFHNSSGVGLYVFAAAAGYYEIYGSFAATGP